jgi:hypothetical protein
MADRLTVEDIAGIYNTKRIGRDYGIGMVVPQNKRYSIDGTTPGLLPIGYTVNTHHIIQKILPKLQKAKRIFPRNHELQCKDYPTVFALSDIHADLRKFTQMLISSGLIATPYDPDFNPYTDSIYDPRFIASAQWTAPRGTLLVIIGDLVDGKRSFNRGAAPFNQVADSRGSFELLIFALLYNLRIQANANGSEIRFTVGNHELISVINNVKPAEYLPYVHDTAVNFFTNDAKSWSDMRRVAILPFLELCPYYILTLQNGATNEVVFVHGGLHINLGGVVQGLSATLTGFQAEIDAGTRPFDNITPEITEEGLSPLWTRFYASTQRGVCNTLSPEYKLIIVGHCVTSTNFPRFNELKQGNALYSLCDDGKYIKVDGMTQEKNLHGCVLLDCPAERDDDIGAPRLGFVDTAMSACQHLPNLPAQGFLEIPRDVQIVQMMKLSHIDKPSIRYYNRVERVLSPTGTVELLYETQVVGGRRKTRRNRASSMRSRRSKNRKTKRR